MNLQQQASALFEDQKQTWPLLGENWKGLAFARLRVFEFPGFTIRVQFNPKRITSSAARVDRDSIARRKCFLCPENRPPEERHVPFGSGYEILCNPFPIFNEHFTIARREHTPQVIDTEFGNLLYLSRELPELVVFYNAPNCGASAPDHMHFQAGNRGFMPIEEEIGTLKERYGGIICQDEKTGKEYSEVLPRNGSACKGSGTGLVMAVDDGLRRFILLESETMGFLGSAFNMIHTFMAGLRSNDDPMLNILSYYSDRWQVMIFPREKHRPWQYFEKGERNILLSPASVDMGGTLITPLEKDFQKITRDDIDDIFSQVSFSPGLFRQLTRYLKSSLA